MTSIFSDLGLGVGNRYSVSILVYTVASVTFQLPATVLVRMLGPRVMFSLITVSFGIITMVSAKSKEGKRGRGETGANEEL